MTNIILSGCNGKMGQVICRLARENPEATVVAGFDPFTEVKNDFPVFPAPQQIAAQADVIIDFSNPASLDALLDFALLHKLPLVISTTGHTSEQKERITAASKEIPVFMSGNMSLGINLMMNLVAQAAKTLEGLFDIELIEKHHNKKIDAPSGTALMLADAINDARETKCDYVFERASKREKRGASELGIHSIRGGTIVGEHSVIFAGNDEIIEITHTAMSRKVFAVGALKAATYMVGRPAGLYSMKEVIQESI